MTHFVASALSPKNTLPQAGLIVNRSDKTSSSSEYFLPVHVKALETEIFRENSPVTIMSIRIENAAALLKQKRKERSDQLLDQIIKYLSGKFDAPKIFTRHSDQGLALVLTGLSEQEIHEFEYTIREALSRVSFNLEGTQIKLEFEYGLASFPSDGSDLKKLIEISWARTTHSEEGVHG